VYVYSIGLKLKLCTNRIHKDIHCYYYHWVDTSSGGLVVPYIVYQPASNQCCGTDMIY